MTAKIFAAVTLLVAAIAVGVVAGLRQGSVEGGIDPRAPGPRAHLQVPTDTADPYPGGGTPEPVPTQTAIATGVYEGESHEDIADVVAEQLENSGIAGTEPSLVDSADVTPQDAAPFDMESDAISFQSTNDVALVFSGEFNNMFPGDGSGSGSYDYLLVLVDTDSAVFRGVWLSDTLGDLTDRLP